MTEVDRTPLDKPTDVADTVKAAAAAEVGQPRQFTVSPLEDLSTAGDLTQPQPQLDIQL